MTSKLLSELKRFITVTSDTDNRKNIVIRQSMTPSAEKKNKTYRFEIVHIDVPDTDLAWDYECEAKIYQADVTIVVKE